VNSKYNHTNDGHTYCGSPEELGNQLAILKAAGKLPAIIHVDAGNEPFYTDSKGKFSGGSEASHYVTVTDYIAGPPAKVEVDNQWSRNANHLGDKAIDLDTLYYSTLPPGSPEQIDATLAQIREANREHKETTELELQLNRLQYVAKDPVDRISDAEYDRQVKKIMGSAIHRWEREETSGTINEAERKEAWIDYYNMNRLPKNDNNAKVMKASVDADVKASQGKHHNKTDFKHYYEQYQTA
jgi:hypothetical protein